MRLKTSGQVFELPAIKYEFNKRNFILFIRFLITCGTTCHCTDFILFRKPVQLSMNAYLLTYLQLHYTVSQKNVPIFVPV